MTKLSMLAALLVLLALLALNTQAQVPAANPLIERGRHLVKTTGGNDCHSAGDAQRAGQIAGTDGLQGDRLDWQGPWGSTYATNLRLHLSPRTEEQWLVQARQRPSRPPMPWFGLRDMSDMSDADLKAIDADIKAAGPAGEPAPADLSPGQPARGPVIKYPG